MAGLVIVTGAAGVLGRAVVRTLVAAGRRVAAVDLGSVAESEGVHAFDEVDLSDEALVATTFARVAEIGPIDGLVAVAGGFTWEKMGPEGGHAFDRMYQVNVRTAAIACGCALPHLVKDASIVTIAAAAATRPGVGMAAYAAAKAGVLAMTESLAEQLRGQARVNAILPTIIDTPVNRADMPQADPAIFVPPAEIADLVAFLLSPAAACVTGAAIRTR